MKTTERHGLKHNEVADTLQGAYLQLERNRKAILIIAGVVAAVACVWGGYSYFAAQKEARAGALLAQALVVAEAQVVPPIAPAPGQTAPPAAPGTYPSDTARLEATMPKYLAAADAYPGTQAGISARYQAAAALMALGKAADARKQYEGVIAADGRGLYGRMARLGVAEIDVKAGQFDPAIATLRELSLDARGDLPVDAILVQLAQAYVAAGKKTEAQQALQRVTTEFATSPYAADAKKLLETIKPGA
ncbi:MAG: tetratricopeptide repeat protein [Vicinamibacteria bacterium]|nr:tetratricopeptide repeat protein [Vicinamibacteria bacterium]